MTDEELIERLRDDHPDYLTAAAADCIEALVKERDYWIERCGRERAFASSHFVRADRLEAALREIAADCDADYPPSHGAIKQAIRAALKGADHE